MRNHRKTNRKRTHTRDGVAKLLPVTPDVSRPHSGEASDARKGGARQDEWPLTANLCESTGGEANPANLRPLNNFQNTHFDWVQPVCGKGLSQPVHVVQVVVGGQLLLGGHTQSPRAQLAANHTCLSDSKQAL